MLDAFIVRRKYLGATHSAYDRQDCEEEAIEHVLSLFASQLARVRAANADNESSFRKLLDDERVYADSPVVEATLRPQIDAAIEAYVAQRAADAKAKSR